MSEECFRLTPYTLITNEGQKHLASPWLSNSTSMYSAATDPWSYFQPQSITESHLEPLLPNAESPFDQTINLSGTEGSNVYPVPKETEYPRTGTMVLEHLEPEIVNKLISVLVESKGPVKMRLF